MFEIAYQGGNTVTISTKQAKLITDPKQSLIGLKDANTKNAIALSTEARFATDSEDAVLNIEGPGDYEIADFSIHGVAARRHIDSDQEEKLATLYRIEVGDARIALLGNIDGNLSETQLEEIGVVDIAILPVGGNGYTLDATSAAQVVRKLDVKVVIPVHYNDGALAYEVAQDELDVFLKELGAEHEQTPKYKVKSGSVLPTTRTVVEITRS